MTKILNLVNLTVPLASRQFIFRKVELFKEIGKSSYHSLHDINHELRKTIQELNQVNRELNELKGIVLPNQNCSDFMKLKNEIARLKIKELAPQLQSQKEQAEKLITDSKKQLSEESKTVLDFYLTTLKQEENNSSRFGETSLKAGKLVAYEDILKTKLTSENVQQIKQLQQKINQDQKHLDSLQKVEKQEAKVQQAELFSHRR